MLQRKTLASGGPWCRTHVRCWKKKVTPLLNIQTVHRVGGRPYNLEVQEVIQSLLKEMVLLLVPPKSQWPIRNYEIKNSNHNNLKSNFSLTFHRFDWGDGENTPHPQTVPRSLHSVHSKLYEARATSQRIKQAAFSQGSQELPRVIQFRCCAQHQNTDPKMTF